MSKLKGAIFDLDGTLLDSMGVWNQIDVEFLAKRGLAVPEDYLEAITPMGFERAAEYTIRRFGFQETKEELIAEWYDMARHAYGHTVELKRGAKAYLEKLKKKGVGIAAATSSDTELFVPALKRNGIYGLFDALVTVREVSRGKGFPDIYELAAKKLGAEPGACVVYEDIIQGIRGAKLGGFYTIAVYDASNPTDVNTMRREAACYIHDFEELLGGSVPDPFGV